MAKIWKERRQRHHFGGDVNRYASPMWGQEQPGFATSQTSLVPEWAYFVEVNGFTFEFWSVEQIETALAYFSQKTHVGTAKFQDLPNHHHEGMRWFERLPTKLFRRGKREKVIAALERALHEFADEYGTGGIGGPA